MDARHPTQRADSPPPVRSPSPAALCESMATAPLPAQMFCERTRSPDAVAMPHATLCPAGLRVPAHSTPTASTRGERAALKEAGVAEAYFQTLDQMSADIEPIVMKRTGPAAGGCGGAAPTLFKVAVETANRHGINGDPNLREHHQLASRDAQGSWRKGDGVHRDAAAVEGSFSFVRMLNGELRLGPRVDGQNVHGQLAGNSLHVAYAGTVTFKNGTVEQYSNASGTYMPPADLKAQSGFATSAPFIDHEP